MLTHPRHTALGSDPDILILAKTHVQSEQFAALALEHLSFTQRPMQLLSTCGNVNGLWFTATRSQEFAVQTACHACNTFKTDS